MKLFFSRDNHLDDEAAEKNMQVLGPLSPEVTEEQQGETTQQNRDA